MKSIVVYNVITGEITSVRDVPESMMSIQAQEGQSYLELGDYKLSDEFDVRMDDYVDTTMGVSRIVCKPEITSSFDKVVIQADDVDTATINDLPDDCQVTIEGDTYTVTDNTFELTVPLPGIYTITIEKFPFIPKEVQIEAIA